MKTLLLYTLFLFTGIAAFAQADTKKLTDSIVEEGKKLYRSEMASWYGTDIFLEKYGKQENIGGYVSYTENGLSKCIFFSKGDAPKVIGTMIFDSTYNVKTASTSLVERALTNTENELRLLRKNAAEVIQGDTFFLHYNNTNLNLIPMISGGEKKVYVLTGPEKNGVVIFGNDYLLQFDANNHLVSKKMLHKNLIPCYYGSNDDKDKITFGAMHSHLPETGDFITATDICTLMLYARFAKWQQHIVVSENYVSIWKCSDNSLFVMNRKAWDKIYSEQEKPKQE